MMVKVYSREEKKIVGVIPKSFFSEMRMFIKSYNEHHFEKITQERLVYMAVRYFIDQHKDGDSVLKSI